MNNPLISVLICCHNRSSYIAATIESVLAQTYQPVEIIVLDDGSEDDTRAVVERFGARVRYCYQPNQGIAAARTNACLRSQGALIAFQDDDDLMPPLRLERLQETLAAHPQCVFAVGDMAFMDQQGRLTGRRWLPPDRLSSGPPLVIDDAYEAVVWPRVPATPHTTLFRREHGEAIGWFNQRYRYASEDKDFFARLGRRGPIVYVPEIVSHYRRGHHSLTANVLRTEYGQLRFLSDHLGSYVEPGSDLEQRLKTRIRRGLCTIQRLETVHGFRFGDPAQCRTLRGEALDRLGLGDKGRYWWEALTKNPLRRLTRGLSGAPKPKQKADVAADDNRAN